MEEAGALGMVGPAGRGVGLSYDFASRDVSVIVDKFQIQQVLHNLIRNAAEAMAGCPRRELQVGAAPASGGMVELSVCDSGCGIAPDLAAELFQPFTTTKVSGMGIGLAISRGIIEAHGGQLWWEPNPSGGAIFKFSLPAGNEPGSGAP